MNFVFRMNNNDNDTTMEDAFLRFVNLLAIRRYKFSVDVEWKSSVIQDMIINVPHIESSDLPETYTDIF